MYMLYRMCYYKIPIVKTYKVPIYKYVTCRIQEQTQKVSQCRYITLQYGLYLYEIFSKKK